MSDEPTPADPANGLGLEPEADVELIYTIVTDPDAEEAIQLPTTGPLKSDEEENT